METEYRVKECVPKGGMCLTCSKQNEDCSGLDFESMPIIEIGLEEIIVRCTEHEKFEGSENPFDVGLKAAFNECVDSYGEQ